MSQIAKRRGQATFDHLLDDPVIQAVMQADRVGAQALRALLQRVAATLPPPEPTEREAAELELSLQPEADPRYRPGVGIVLYNDAGNVFVGRRADVGRASWQMPQGGIEPGETPLAAARRELREEIGTENIDVLAESRAWLRYEVPPCFARASRHGSWRGQQQKWFAMHFRGEDSEINIATEHPEFVAWQWVPATRVAELIIAFKRRLYRDVLAEFESLEPEVAARTPSP